MGGHRGKFFVYIYNGQEVNKRFQPLIAKPDQLIKRRGKLGLIKIKSDLENARDWIREKMASPFKIGETEGTDLKYGRTDAGRPIRAKRTKSI